jgi:predicted nuclease of predicted toxin-antitoxin system
MRTFPRRRRSCWQPTVSTPATYGTAESWAPRTPEVLERAFLEDRVLVTLNVDDFVKLARAREIHAGIVLVGRAGLLRDEQIELIRRVVAKLAEHGAMANELLHVDEHGAMRFEVVPPV